MFIFLSSGPLVEVMDISLVIQVTVEKPMYILRN